MGVALLFIPFSSNRRFFLKKKLWLSETQQHTTLCPSPLDNSVANLSSADLQKPNHFLQDLTEAFH